MRKELSAPRIQMRWDANDGTHRYAVHEYKWLCHYELVLPLDKYDTRREVYGPKGEITKRTELVVPIKGPSARASSSAFPPCTSGDGKSRFYDTPCQDGAHAICDSHALGGIPIYVIAPDGEAFLKPKATP